MRGRLPSDLFERTAEESARLLALKYLDEIDRAKPRLSDPGDAEALHDFRVGLRRLRSCLRAYRRPLKGSVSRKMREKLRDLMQATNSGRDTEVQLAWLGKQGERIGPGDIQGYFWLTGKLEGRKNDSLDQDISEVARRYTRDAARLRRRLGVLRLRVAIGSAHQPLSFGKVTGDLITEHVAQLRSDLVQIRDVRNIKEIHQARIAVKRLRYLLEPVARSNRRARAVVSRLKVAQDLLGEHHDLQLMLEAIALARARLSTSDANLVATLSPGVEKVEQLARERADAAFEQFNSLLGAELASRIISRAEEVGGSLSKGRSGAAYPQPPLEPPFIGNENGAHRAIPAAEPVPSNNN